MLRAFGGCHEARPFPRLLLVGGLALTVLLLVGTLAAGLLVGCGSSSSQGSGFGSGVDAATGGTDATTGGDVNVTTGYDGGVFVSGDASNGSGDGEALPTTITATIHRDFRFYDASDPTANEDFENVPASCMPSCDDRVLRRHDARRRRDADVPSAARTARSARTGPRFQMWYHDTPGSNITVSWPMPIVANPSPDAGPGSVGYDSEIQGCLTPTRPGA